MQKSENVDRSDRKELVNPGKRILLIAGRELKHFSSNRSSLVLGGAAFFFFWGLLLVRSQWGEVLGTTTLGQLAELVSDLMLIMGIILPFLAADRAAHDYHERIHELRMSTAVPTRLYIFGRYLAALAISLGLAVLMLAAQLLANLALPLLNSHFPAADPMITLVLWLRVTIPASIFVGSLSFCLGTLWPRHTGIPKLTISFGWIILALGTDPTDLSWRVYWNPTGAGMMTQIINQYQINVQRELQTSASPAAIAGIVLRLQQVMPSLRPWTGPFLVMAGIGLLLGIVLAFLLSQFDKLNLIKPG